MQTLFLQANDGYSIGAKIHQPRSSIKASIVIAPAMGLSQSYYQPLALWLCEQNYRVLTFDYRGMGESKHGPLSELDCDILTWAREDAGCALAHAVSISSGEPIIWLGHSLGGQITAVVPGIEAVHQVIMIASGSGYWRTNSPATARKAPFLWYFLAPLCCALFGYFPGKKMGVVGDIPKAVMQQWRRWCLHPGYMVGCESKQIAAAVRDFSAPIDSIYFEDDELISGRSIKDLLAQFESADCQLHTLDSTGLCDTAIGHFGFFKARHKELLWRRYLLDLINAPEVEQRRPSVD